MTEPTSLSRVVLNEFRRVLQRPALAAADDFFAAGGNSLAAAELMSRIAEATGFDRHESLLLEHPTAEQLAAHLTEPPRAVVPIRAHGELPPMVVVHGASGNVFAVARLAAAFGPDQPVWVAQVPKRRPAAGEPPQRYEHLPQLLAIEPAGPCVVLGMSAMGIAALRIAAKLEAAGRPVQLLVVLDARPPGPETEAPRISGRILAIGSNRPERMSPWSQYAGDGFRLCAVDAGAGRLLTEPIVRTVAAEVVAETLRLSSR